MSQQLQLTIWSFSYRSGAPVLHGPDGGGFIFDCRLLPNPGREEKYVARTGRDPDVIDYLQQRPEVSTFVAQVFGLLSLSVISYQSRGYTNLFVAFGCTGGQHRSVYCAETVSKQLQDKFGDSVSVSVQHVELVRRGFRLDSDK